MVVDWKPTKSQSPWWLQVAKRQPSTLKTTSLALDDRHIRPGIQSGKQTGECGGAVSEVSTG